MMSKTRSLVCFEDAVADEQPARSCCRPHLVDMQRESLTRSFESETSTFSQNIGTSTFCRAFPWHFMVDRNMQLVQLGVGFMRLFGSELKKMGRHLATYFQMKKPTVEPNFDKILKKANSPFVLAVCHVTKDSRKTKLEVSYLCRQSYRRVGSLRLSTTRHDKKTCHAKGGLLSFLPGETIQILVHTCFSATARSLTLLVPLLIPFTSIIAVSYLFAARSLMTPTSLIIPQPRWSNWISARLEAHEFRLQSKTFLFFLIIIVYFWWICWNVTIKWLIHFSTRFLSTKCLCSIKTLGVNHRRCSMTMERYVLIEWNDIFYWWFVILLKSSTGTRI